MAARSPVRGEACPDTENYVPEIRLSGSYHMAETLVPAMIRGFADRNMWSVTVDETDGTKLFEVREGARPRGRFHLHATTTREGYADLLAEEADIALALRAPTDVEIARAAGSDAGDLTTGYRASVVGLDGLAVVASEGTGLESATLAELARRFSTSEPEMDVYLPPRRDALFEIFEATVMAPFGKQVHDKALTDTDPRKVLDRASPAVGVLRMSETSGTVPVALRDVCGMAFPADDAHVLSGDYPLTIQAMLYTPARRLPDIAQDFIGFAGSPAADTIVRDAGFMAVTISEAPFQTLDMRLPHAVLAAESAAGLAGLQKFVSLLDGYSRLPVTFRFAEGNTPDALSRNTIARLAAWIAEGRFDGRDLIFVGFTDSVGGPTANTDLSRTRAEIVRDAVLAHLGDRGPRKISLAAHGLGETAPVACETPDPGVATNRRVELWVAQSKPLERNE